MSLTLNRLLHCKRNWIDKMINWLHTADRGISWINIASITFPLTLAPPQATTVFDVVNNKYWNERQQAEKKVRRHETSDWKHTFRRKWCTMTMTLIWNKLVTRLTLFFYFTSTLSLRWNWKFSLITRLLPAVTHSTALRAANKINNERMRMNCANFVF